MRGKNAVAWSEVLRSKRLEELGHDADQAKAEIKELQWLDRDGDVWTVDPSDKARFRRGLPTSWRLTQRRNGVQIYSERFTDRDRAIRALRWVTGERVDDVDGGSQ